MKLTKFTIIPLLFIVLFAASCGSKTPAAPTATPTAILTPTATQPPMAISINAVGVSLEEYQQELVRLQQAQAQLGTSATPEEQKQKVLDDFTNQLLLEQGALQGGFTLDDVTLQARIDSLASQLGGQDKLIAWEAANNYTVDTFREAMRRSIAVA